SLFKNISSYLCYRFVIPKGRSRVIRGFKVIRNIVALIFVTFSSSLAWGQDCAGFERVSGYKSEIAKSCLGLAATESQVPWAMPRQLMFENESSLLVSDLGGWKFPTAGKVFRINLKNMSYQVIYQGGRFTHGLGKD